MTKTYKEWVRYFLDNGAGLKLAENLARHYVELQNISRIILALTEI